MSAPRFFVPGPIPRDRAAGELALPDAAAVHAVRVLRLGAGDPVTLFDGFGGEHHATIVAVGRRAATVRIERFDPVERELPARVTIVMAVIATDQMDFAVRKSVELGAFAVRTVIAARSQGIPAGERAGRRVAHWRAIATAACEQCGRNRVPAIEPPVPVAEWLRELDDARGAVALLAPDAQVSLATLAARAPPRYVLVGPEGGFTRDEIDGALRAGAVPAHLGRRVLRAETAALAALATFNAMAGDAAQEA